MQVVPCSMLVGCTLDRVTPCEGPISVPDPLALSASAPLPFRHEHLTAVRSTSGALASPTPLPSPLLVGHLYHRRAPSPLALLPSAPSVAMATGGRKRRAPTHPMPTPPTRMARTARPTGDGAGSASGHTEAAVALPPSTRHAPSSAARTPPGGDVPRFDHFFPPASKLPSSDPFVTQNFNKVILGTLQALYLTIKATGRVPAVLAGKGYVLSSVLDANDEACLSQLRTFLNDGRAAARAFFYRYIGYFLMNPSPKVYIRLVHPTASMPDIVEAEGSPSFAIETCHVGSSTGVVAAVRPPGGTGPIVTGPSGGTFTTVRSAAVGSGFLRLNISVKRDIGTDS